MDVTTCDVMIIISRTSGHLWDEQWLGHINNRMATLLLLWNTGGFVVTALIFFTFGDWLQAAAARNRSPRGWRRCMLVSVRQPIYKQSQLDLDWLSKGLYSHFTNGCNLFLMDLKWLKLHHDFLRHFWSSVSNLWGSGSLMWLSVSEDKQQISHFLKLISVLSQTDRM